MAKREEREDRIPRKTYEGRLEELNLELVKMGTKVPSGPKPPSVTKVNMKAQ